MSTLPPRADIFTLWTMATPKISILSCRDKPDAQDIPHLGGHHEQFARRGRTPSLDPVAGNGLINRRALLGQGIAVAGATAPPGPSPAPPPSRSRTSSGASKFGSIMPPVQTAVAIREGRRAHAEQSEGRIPQLACAHAAPSAQRHHHAERRCTSPSIIAACPTSTPPSTSW